MIRKLFIVAGIAALALVTAGSMASAKLASTQVGNNGARPISNSPQGWTVPKADVKPNTIRKDFGLRVHCMRPPNWDKLGVFVVTEQHTLLR